MTQHNLLDAVKKLLPHAEAEQEALYKVTLKYPGRQQAKSDYEDCRHAVSYAYEALNEATRKPMPGAASTIRKHTPGPWEVHGEHYVHARVHAGDTDILYCCANGHAVNHGLANLKLAAAAPDMLEALEQALVALNTAPRFKVPILGVIDSYAVAAICEAAIAKAKGDA